MMMDHDRNIGLVLNGRYRVHERLGSGSHGHVYLGKQVGTERKVAIKLLRRESLEDPELEARFQREGLVMCSLKSAHTITTYDFDRTNDGIMYIVMELSDGKPLSHLMEQEAPLAWRRVLGMLSQMCEALAEAHDISIVHRDLKPANILVENRPGNPDFLKILDFGIAKLLHGEPLGMDTVPKLTARGQTIGTLRYMSPEQLMGAPLDGRSDIYTLGVLAFELLTRYVPFPEATRAAQLIAAQLRQVPPAPSAVYPEGEIPMVVDKMVERMLAKDPEDRFASAHALLEVCESVLNTDPSQLAMARAASVPPTVDPAGRGHGVGGYEVDEEMATRVRAASNPPPFGDTAPVPRLESERGRQLRLVLIASVVAALVAGFITWAVL